MNLISQLSAWVDSLFRHPTPPAGIAERQRQQEQRRREDGQILRQLEAELELMRRWKHGGRQRQ